jgi:hypothetical protein
MPSKQDLANRGLRLWQEWQVKPAPVQFDAKPKPAVEVSETAAAGAAEKTKIIP